MDKFRTKIQILKFLTFILINFEQSTFCIFIGRHWFALQIQLFPTSAQTKTIF